MNPDSEKHQEVGMCQLLSEIYLNICIAGVRLKNEARNNDIHGLEALSAV